MANNYQKFLKEVVDSSTASSWEEARLEWQITHHTQGETHCACGKNIYYQYHIRNNTNGKRLTVGSTCINKFHRGDLNEYVNRVEKARKEDEKRRKWEEARIEREKAWEAGREERERERLAEILAWEANYEAEYTKLKEQQTYNKVELSVRKSFLEKRHKAGIINDFELNFYLNIYWEVTLTPKQEALKKKVNKKMLDL